MGPKGRMCQTETQKHMVCPSLAEYLTKSNSYRYFKQMRSGMECLLILAWKEALVTQTPVIPRAIVISNLWQ